MIIAHLYQRRVHGLRLDTLRATFRRLELLQIAAARVAFLAAGHVCLSLRHLTRIVKVLHAHIVVAVFFSAIGEGLAVAAAQRSLLQMMLILLIFANLPRVSSQVHLVERRLICLHRCLIAV